MEGKQVSILKKRLPVVRRSGSMGDLAVGSNYFPPPRRVNFSSTNQVRLFDTSFHSSTLSLGAFGFNGPMNDCAMNSRVGASSRSLMRLVQEETTQSGDVNGVSPYANRSTPTNQLIEDFEVQEMTGSSRSMSMEDFSRVNHQSSFNSFCCRTEFEERHKEIPSAINATSTETRESPTTINVDIRVERVPVDFESFGSDNTKCSFKSMSLSLQNNSRAGEQSLERTNSWIRDMSLVEELESLGEGDIDIANVPGPSSQATDTMSQSNNLANRVFIRDGDKAHYQKYEGPPMYFNKPNTQHYANPFRLKPKMWLKEPRTKLSYGKFGCAKTPKRNRIDPTTTTSSQLQHQSTAENTNVDVVHTSSSPLIPSPPLRKTTNDVGLNCTLGMRSSSKNADLRRTVFTSKLYSSTISKPGNHEPKSPTTSGNVAADTSSTPVTTPTCPNMGPHENEEGSDCETSFYSHSDSSLSILALSTHDEEGSTSSQSSPPNVIPESEGLSGDESLDIFEELERQMRNEDTSGSGESSGTITEDENMEEEEDEEEVKDGEVEQNEDVVGVEEDEDGGEVDEDEVVVGLEEDEDGMEECEDGVELEEDEDEDGMEECEDGVELEEDEDGGEEVENRSDDYEREVSQNPQVAQIPKSMMISASFNKPQIDSSQFFEESRLDRHSDRAQDENDMIIVEEESGAPTIVMNSDATQASNEVHLIVTANVSFNANPVVHDLFEKLKKDSVDSDINIFAKWGFLNSKGVTETLSRLAEPEWKAILQYGRIKEFMGDAYINSIEVKRNSFINPEPLFRGVMNLAYNNAYFPKWAQHQSTPHNYQA